MSDSDQVSSSSTLALTPKVSPTSNSVDSAKGEGISGKVMINAVLSQRVLGKDEATVNEGIKGGSSTSSSPDSRGEKDAPSSHRLISSLGALELGSVSSDRSYSYSSLTNSANSTYCLFMASIILEILAKPSAEI